LKLHFTQEWLNRQIAKGDEPDGCPHCGAIAGCCSNYPNCPGGPTVTTTVRILIEGNKACEVKVEGNPGDTPTIVKPGSFTLKNIHGEQTVSVKETGDFV
jgi:hypothetical protein